MNSTAATLQFLHTTEAYQLAVLRLMAAEANFAAARLGLKETVSVSGAMHSHEHAVESPARGVGGYVCSPNYSFCFLDGKLRCISRLGRSSRLGDVLELAEQPCALDKQGAYELAKRWLIALGVDVDAFERGAPPNIFQAPARRRDAYGHSMHGIENNVPLPLFMVSWGGNLSARLTHASRTFPSGVPIVPKSHDALFVEILGTTEEPLGLHINDASLLQRPVLQLPNAAELLGPTPRPQHFVERLFGGPDAYETVARPERLDAWLLTSVEDNARRENSDRAGPVTVAPDVAASFSQTLTNFDSYYWGDNRKGCIVDFGARLRFVRGGSVVGIRLCFQCGIMEVAYNGHVQGKDFDQAHNALVKALQAVFPSDKIVQALALRQRLV